MRDQLDVRHHVYHVIGNRAPRPPLEELSVADFITGLTPAVAATELGVPRNVVWGYRRRNAVNAERRDKLLEAARNSDLGLFWLRLRHKFY